MSRARKRPLAVVALLTILLSACQDPSGASNEKSDLTALTGEYVGTLGVYLSDTLRFCFAGGCEYPSRGATSCGVVTHITNRDGSAFSGWSQVDPTITYRGHHIKCNDGTSGFPMFTPGPVSVTGDVGALSRSSSGGQSSKFTLRLGPPSSRAALESFVGCMLIEPDGDWIWRGGWHIGADGGVRFFASLSSANDDQFPRFRCSDRVFRVEIRWSGERVG